MESSYPSAPSYYVAMVTSVTMSDSNLNYPVELLSLTLTQAASQLIATIGRQIPRSTCLLMGKMSVYLLQNPMNAKRSLLL